MYLFIGLRWNQRSSYCLDIPNVKQQFNYNPNQMYVNFTCVMSLDLIYKIYIILWIGFFVLAIYFDNILPNEFNVRRSVCTGRVLVAYKWQYVRQYMCP